MGSWTPYYDEPYGSFGQTSFVHKKIHRDEIYVSALEYHLANDLHKRENLHRSVHDFLVRQIFPRDLMPKAIRTLEDGTQESLKVEQKFIVESDVWKSVLEAAFTEICILGIVAIDVSQKIPTVYSDSLGSRYVITVRENYTTGKKEFRFYRKFTQNGYLEFDPDVVILSGFGYDPLPDGRLTSIEAGLIKSEEMYSMNISIQLNGAWNNSHKPVLYAVQGSEREVSPTYIALPTGSNPWDTGGRIRKLGEISETIFDANRSLHRRYQEETLRLWPQRFTELGNNGVVPQWEQMIPLPAGSKVEKQQPAQLRQDTEELNTDRKDALLGSYGIQHIDLYSTKAHKIGSTATAQNTSRLLADTINRWRARLGQVLTVIMHKNDRNKSFDCLCKNPKAGNKVEFHIECATQKYCERFTFPLMPVLKSDEILQIAESGAIDEASFRSVLSQATWVPEESIVLPKDKQTETLELEEQRHRNKMAEIKLQQDYALKIAMVAATSREYSEYESTGPPRKRAKKAVA